MLRIARTGNISSNAARFAMIVATRSHASSVELGSRSGIVIASAVNAKNKSKLSSLMCLMGLSVLCFLINSNDASCYASKAKDTPLTLEELKDALKSELKAIRGKLQSKGIAAPSLFIVGQPDSKKVAVHLTHTLSITDILGLIGEWSKAIPAAMNLDISPTKAALTTFSLRSTNGNISLTVRSNSEANTVSVILEKPAGAFTQADVERLSKGYELAFSTSAGAAHFKEFPAGQTSIENFFHGLRPSMGSQTSEMPSFSASGNVSHENPIAALRDLGVEVYDREQNSDLSWDCLAGYNDVKVDIEETVLNAIKFPEIYEQITERTRVLRESNRPKAVLLSGSPGTGKTLTARILASRCDRPLICLQPSNFASKWYGESEKKLTEILDLCDAMEGTIIFIDEIDGLVTSRDGKEMHEATRRLLAIILQRMEGFKGKGKSLFIGATNRPQDLDSALLSRFDMTINYPLPDTETRKAVLCRYAKQFAGDAATLALLAGHSEGFSCREIKEVCEQAERRWATKAIKQQERHPQEVVGGTPTAEDYLVCMRRRKAAVAIATGRREGNPADGGYEM